MLFLIISTPRPEKPSNMSKLRQSFWRWTEPQLKSGQLKWTYARTGRGAVALFDVPSNEELHRLLNEWAEIIPAQFDIYPLIDVAASQRFLATQTKSTRRR